MQSKDEEQNPKLKVKESLQSATPGTGAGWGSYN